MSKTIFIDIDGTILSHPRNVSNVHKYEQKRLDGVLDKFNEWLVKDYMIIITTARPESLREITLKQLESLGLFCHQLVMGCRCGPRIVINDIKDDGTMTAFAINLNKNEGLTNIQI